MDRLKKLALPALLLAGLGAGAVAFAGARGDGGGEGHRWHHQAPKSVDDVRDHLDRMSEKLLAHVDGVSDAQRDQIGDILDKAAPELYQAKVDGKALHQELRAALTAEKVDAKQVEKIREDAVDVVDKASKATVDTLVQVANTLTPEQRAQLADRLGQLHAD